MNSYRRTGLPYPYTSTAEDLKIYLAEHQFSHKASDTRARLSMCAERCYRGHLSYDGQNIKKLRALVQSRGIKTHLQGRPNKKQLVKLLEAADDDVDAMESSREFHKFSQLPPELRNRVYVCYFKSLGDVPPRFLTPPLCRASRQSRLESTGLFFEHCTFVVQVKPIFPETRLQYHNEVARHRIPAHDFARIKHLFIELRTPFHRSLQAAWTVDLTNGQCVEVNISYYPGGTRDKGHVRDLIDSIMACDGTDKLKKSDMDTLEVAVAKQY